MLYEISNIRQYEGEHRRRWFFDHEIDLTVWVDSADRIVAFQLCYDKTQNQHALTWRQDTGYHHNRVDDGESDDSIGRFKGTPMLFMDGEFDEQRIALLFRKESKDIPERIARFVYDRIKAHQP